MGRCRRRRLGPTSYYTEDNNVDLLSDGNEKLDRIPESVPGVIEIVVKRHGQGLAPFIKALHKREQPPAKGPLRSLVLSVFFRVSRLTRRPLRSPEPAGAETWGRPRSGAPARAVPVNPFDGIFQPQAAEFAFRKIFKSIL